MKKFYSLLLASFFFAEAYSQTWQALSIPTTQNIKSSSFINDAEGWIGFENATATTTLYQTADSGTTWNPVSIPGASSGTSFVFFVNASVGYVVIDEEAFKTGDGGTTWTQLTMPNTPYNNPCFLNEDTGFIPGDDEVGVFKTTDGGVTWNTYDTDYTRFYEIEFINDSVGAGVEYDGYLLGTTDGGESWYYIDDGGLWSYFFGMGYGPDEKLYYTGYSDNLNYSVEIYGGKSAFSSEDINDLYDIRFFTNERGYAVGGSGLIMKTEDGGFTWQEDDISSATLNVIDGFNYIYVFGTSGKGYKLAPYCAAAPIFDFTTDDLEVTFIDQSLDAVSWFWDFGDGDTSTSQNPAHLFPATGKYNVCLTVSNDSCGSDMLCHTVTVCAANFSASIAGTLDISFGGDGIVTDEITGAGDFIRSLAIQPDGKIIAGGYLPYPTIARYNTDGTMDSSFDDDGVLSDIQITGNCITSLAPDGKIVIGGQSGQSDIQIKRYHSDGSVDISFGDSGKVVVDLSQQTTQDNFISITIAPDGKILAYGHYYSYYSDESEAGVARLNVDGSLDSSFSGNGIANLENFDDLKSGDGDIALQDDGKILLCGNSNNDDEKFAVMRLHADGSADSSFHSDGLVFTNFSTGTSDYDIANIVLSQPDGKIIAAGSAYAGPSDLTNGNIALVRYDPDGTVDNSFGSAGKVMFQIDSSASYAYDVALQTDGKILITGYFGNYSEQVDQIGLVRLNEDGTIDSAFGTDGIVRTHVNCEITRGYSVALHGDKIYVGGNANSSSTDHFVLARYLSKCSQVLADFSHSLNGLEAEFSDESAGAIAWLWDFGDGITSTSQNPSHTFATEGNYNVCLIISDSCGSNTSCQTISVCDPLNTDYLYTAIELDIQFLNQITEATSFFWNFGDGTTSYDQNPVHTFPSTGTYNVCLIEWDDCASDTMCKDIIICGILTTDFIYNATDLSVQFTDASVNAISWNWGFGDGNFSSDQNPLYEYFLPGTYTACLSTFNGCTYDTLCQSIAIIASSTDLFTFHHSPFTIYPNPFNDLIIIEYALPIASAVSIQLTDLSGKTLHSFSAGNKSEGKSHDELDLTEIAAGVYILKFHMPEHTTCIKIIKQ